MIQFKFSQDLQDELKGRTVVRTTVNGGTLCNVINWVAENYPEHEFVIVQAYFNPLDAGGVEVNVRSVKIRHNGVVLGFLTSRYSSRSNGYAVDVDQYENGKRRTLVTSKLMTKLRPAMKVMLTPPDLSDIATDTVRLLRTHLDNRASYLRRKFMNEEDRLEAPMREFIRANVDAFVAFVGDPSKTNAWVEALSEREEHADVLRMYNDLSGGHMVAVAELADGTLIVGDKAYRSFDEIPEKYKEALGMLKLAPDDLILDGFGARCGTRYAIYPRATDLPVQDLPVEASC